MRYILLFILALTIGTTVHAHDFVKAEPDEVYASIPIEGDMYVVRQYLGDLDNAPDMYEFSTDVAITLKMQLKQRAWKKAAPFGLMLVRQNDLDNAVVEVVRQNEPLDSWNEVKNYKIGVKLLESPVLEAEILPGTYRIEVSSPDNKGNYLLLTGEESSYPGFFSMYAHIFQIQNHFDYFPLRFFFSYYGYGMLIVLAAGFAGYWYRRFKDTNRA